MTRIEALRNHVLDMISRHADDGIISQEAQRAAYTHLYGASCMAALLAAKRDNNAELATMAGMLHDIAYFAPMADIPEGSHAERGAIIAMVILSRLNVTSREENETICTAIQRHERKDAVDTPFDEILKDADVLAHGLHDVTLKNFRGERWDKVCREIGMINYR